jgi:hypothetical protein|tara:strand:+ start:1398 stop:1649 length:252 start_codon:yes stop_codon:yes gene_type:complete
VDARHEEVGHAKGRGWLKCLVMESLIRRMHSPREPAFSVHRYARLNALDFSHEEKLNIVDEANEIFMLHLGILEELDRNALPT